MEAFARVLMRSCDITRGETKKLRGGTERREMATHTPSPQRRLAPEAACRWVVVGKDPPEHPRHF